MAHAQHFLLFSLLLKTKQNKITSTNICFFCMDKVKEHRTCSQRPWGHSSPASYWLRTLGKSLKWLSKGESWYITWWLCKGASSGITTWWLLSLLADKALGNDQKTWGLIPALLLTRSVTLSKSCTLSESRFIICKTGIIITHILYRIIVRIKSDVCNVFYNLWLASRNWKLLVSL